MQKKMMNMFAPAASCWGLLAVVLVACLTTAVANADATGIEVGIDGQVMEEETSIPFPGAVGVDCNDLHEQCAMWESLGDCDVNTGNPNFMYFNCPKSCNLCGKGDLRELLTKALAEKDCQDLDEKCPYWESIGECDEVDGNPKYMFPHCPKSCNLCGKGDIAELVRRAEIVGNKDLAISGWGEEQEIPELPEKDKVLAVLEDVKRYMLEEVNVEEKYQSYKKKCQNRHPSCAYWASLGECEANPGYMQLKCAPVCKTCHMVSFNHRCPMPENIPGVDAWKPGDMDTMFERIIVDYPHVNIFSRPSNVTVDDGPWVITIDHFLSDDECERLIELGHVEGYKRSSDVGKMNWDGTFEESVNEGRTSTNAWCAEKCRADEKTLAVLEKIEKLTGISDENSESLQLLRYEPGQFYKTHHDYIEADVERPQGVRILTVFLYLNEPEEGGGTNFPTLGTDGLTVMPKRGSVLLWPSVLNEQPNEKDFRTEHQALPVEKGLKFGANAWVHMRDFKAPHAKGCT